METSVKTEPYKHNVLCYISKLLNPGRKDSNSFLIDDRALRSSINPVVDFYKNNLFDQSKNVETNCELYEIEPGKFVGTVVIQGIIDNKYQDKLRKGSNILYDVIRQVVYGTNLYYLDILAEAKVYEEEKTTTLSSNIINGEILPDEKCRYLFVFLSNHIDTIIYNMFKGIGIVDTMQGYLVPSIVTLAKLYVMYNSPYGSCIFKDIHERTIHESPDIDAYKVRFLNRVDDLLCPASLTDWLPLSSFKSQDKCRIFQMQLDTRADIYNFLEHDREIIETSSDPRRAETKFKELFLKGEVFGNPSNKPDGGKEDSIITNNIKNYLAFGQELISTKTLDARWKQYQI